MTIAPAPDPVPEIETVAPFTLTMGDLVALERRLERPVLAKNGEALYAAESISWLTWRHVGDGVPFEEWIEDPATTIPYGEVVRMAADLLGFNPEASPTVDPIDGGSAPRRD